MPKTIVTPINLILILILQLVGVIFSINAPPKELLCTGWLPGDPEICATHHSRGRRQQCDSPPPKLCLASPHRSFPVCCGTNRSTNVDECQPNGLCLNDDKNSYFLDFCTDAIGESPSCLRQNTCTSASSGLLN
jgi:hypothetical protein